MPFSVSPLLESDIPAFASIDCAAMHGWPLAEAMSLHASIPRQELIESWVRQSFSADPAQIYIKATDDKSGEIVACALWKFQESVGDESGEVIASKTSALIEDGGERKANELQAAPGDVGQEMKKSWQAFQRSHFPAQSYAHLQILIANPKHQRRGAGSLLTAWGCERADQKGLITVLTSSEAGLKTYLNAGFETVRLYDLDLRPFGIEATEVRRWMIRQPKAAREM